VKSRVSNGGLVADEGIRAAEYGKEVLPRTGPEQRLTIAGLRGNESGPGPAPQPIGKKLVAKGGIEPPTQGFSVLCSTN
jgi:hypothetical protein